MTPRRWVVVAAAGIVPVLVVVVLLAGMVVDATRLAAGFALALVVAALAVVALIAAALRRRYRRARAVLDGESIALGGPSLRVSTGDALVADWPRTRRIVAGRALGLTPDAVAAFGMATRSPFARDQLAGLATAWRLTADDIAAIVTHAGSPEAVSLALGRADASTLLLLARTFASADPQDEAADALARYVARTPDVAGLPMSARQWLLERLVVAGDIATATRLLGRSASTMHGQLLALDLLNPFIVGAVEATPAPWIAALSSVYQRAGLEGVELLDGGHPPLDRLRARPAASLEARGPLVSIIMTTYRPDPIPLRTAVESVLAQSWEAWELLLVDDASPPEFDDLLTEMAKKDNRIRLIRASANAGTYVRRNDALLVAEGELVTMHDSDDWMHPRRLEAQVRHLIARPELLANVCRSARVTPQVRFVQPRGTLLRLTEASLLFRRVPALERVGYFDSVRKGADSGFRHRLEAVMGRPVPVVDVEAPLVLSRFEESSLSGADLRDGWTHPSRVAYSAAHGHWIATERSAGREPRLAFPLVTRPFPAPGALLGEDDPAEEVDVVFVLDVRADPRRAVALRRHDADIRAALDAGVRVGLRRLDAPTPSGLLAGARSGVQELVNGGRVVELLPGRVVTARLVVVLEAEVLLGAPEEDGGIEAPELLIVAPVASAAEAEILAGAGRLVPGAQPSTVSLSEARRAVEKHAR
jgi:O-antigen biosynthesis protein